MAIKGFIEVTSERKLSMLVPVDKILYIEEYDKDFEDFLDSELRSDVLSAITLDCSLGYEKIPIILFTLESVEQIMDELIEATSYRK